VSFRRRQLYIYGSISLNCFENEKSLSCREKTYFIFNNFFSQKLCLHKDNVKKYDRARQATSDNIIRCMRFAYWITKPKNKHSYSCISTAIIVDARRSHITVCIQRLSPSSHNTFYIRGIPGKFRSSHKCFTDIKNLKTLL
jgi:hypothetical protein